MHPRLRAQRQCRVVAAPPRGEERPHGRAHPLAPPPAAARSAAAAWLRHVLLLLLRLLLRLLLLLLVGEHLLLLPVRARAELLCGPRSGAAAGARLSPVRRPIIDSHIVEPQELVSWQVHKQIVIIVVENWDNWTGGGVVAGRVAVRGHLGGPLGLDEVTPKGASPRSPGGK